MCHTSSLAHALYTCLPVGDALLGAAPADGVAAEAALSSAVEAGTHLFLEKVCASPARCIEMYCNACPPLRCREAVAWERTGTTSASLNMRSQRQPVYDNFSAV